jgi:RNA polymerase sigma-70 factor (ECF subfamily)
VAEPRPGHPAILDLNLNLNLNQNRTADDGVADDGVADAGVADDGFAESDAVRMAELDSLVEPAAKGDRDALSRLLEIIRPMLVRYSRGKIGSFDRGGMTADDVAQEICLAVMTALPRYRDEARPFIAFVYGIAAHKIADVHRAAARNKADAMAELPEVAVADDGPLDKVIAFEVSGEIGILLSALSAKDRDILLLRVALELTAEEVAEALGSTPGAIRVAQHRALVRLRAALARMAAGEPLQPRSRRKKRTRTR